MATTKPSGWFIEYEHKTHRVTCSACGLVGRPADDTAADVLIAAHSDAHGIEAAS